jgi:hypothetical protein
MRADGRTDGRKLIVAFRNLQTHLKTSEQSLICKQVISVIQSICTSFQVTDEKGRHYSAGCAIAGSYRFASCGTEHQAQSGCHVRLHSGTCNALPTMTTLQPQRSGCGLDDREYQSHSGSAATPKRTLG